MISIINYGSGNISAIRNMLEFVGGECQIVDDADSIIQATALVLPGIGAFDRCAKLLSRNEISEAIRDKVKNQNTPILGICLGFQLLTAGSEEGIEPGLCIIPGFTKRFQVDSYENLVVPHMSWEEVSVSKPHYLTDKIEKGDRFYFAHSFHVVCDNSEDVLMQSDYGYTYTAAASSGSAVGVQFHPEKSHRFGKVILKNFVDQCREQT